MNGDDPVERIYFAGEPVAGLGAEQVAYIAGLPDATGTFTGFHDTADLTSLMIGVPVIDEHGQVIGHVVGPDEPADVTVEIDDDGPRTQP